MLHRDEPSGSVVLAFGKVGRSTGLTVAGLAFQRPSYLWYGVVLRTALHNSCRRNTTPNGESRSGTSVNAGTHVSKFGHLDVKALLHMVAMASIRCNEQVKGYYKRKKEEGKPGLLVLNNIKNKIVHQIFAVVRSQVPYDPAFVHHRAAA